MARIRRRPAILPVAPSDWRPRTATQIYVIAFVIYDAVTALFPLAYSICHVKDSEAGENGKVVRVDLKKTFAILKASNYRGYCSMEWEGAGNPYDGTRFLLKSSLENL